MLPTSTFDAAGKRAIPGTPVFDGDKAQAGYALNAMCYSFNHEENREAFRADEEGYMARFDLTEPQKVAVRGRNVLGMMPHPERMVEPAHGGNDGRRLFESVLAAL